MSKNSAYFSITSLNNIPVGENGNLVSVDFDDTGVTPQMLRNCLTDMGYTVGNARMVYFD